MENESNNLEDKLLVFREAVKVSSKEFLGGVHAKEGFHGKRRKLTPNSSEARDKVNFTIQGTRQEENEGGITNMQEVKELLDYKIDLAQKYVQSLESSLSGQESAGAYASYPLVYAVLKEQIYSEKQRLSDLIEIRGAIHKAESSRG